MSFFDAPSPLSSHSVASILKRRMEYKGIVETSSRFFSVSTCHSLPLQCDIYDTEVQPQVSSHLASPRKETSIKTPCLFRQLFAAPVHHSAYAKPTSQPKVGANCRSLVASYMSNRRVS